MVFPGPLTARINSSWYSFSSLSLSLSLTLSLSVSHTHTHTHTHTHAYQVLATTNTPWDLDDALLRRLEKRIYIPLPEEQARHELFTLNLRTVQLSEDVDLEALAKGSQGYSGSDILTVCREASMAPMRRLTCQLSPMEIMELKNKGELDLQVTFEDIQQALKNTAASVAPHTLAEYTKWTAEFASV